MEDTIKKSSRFRFWKILSFLVFVLAVGSSGYFYLQLKELKNNPQAVAKKEAEALVAKVSRLILLPEGETPTVATVSDPEVLKKQEFFAKAQIGDKVLIFTTAKKAFLYSVTMDKILEVAPLNIGDAKDGKGTTSSTSN